MGDQRSSSDDGESEGRRVGRRPFLQAVGGAGLAAGLTGAAGTAAAQEDWPEVDDPYYQGLVDDYRDQGVPPGEFLYDDTEAGTWEAYEFQPDGAGEVSDLDVSDEDVPFSEAARVDIAADPENSFTVNVRADVQERGVEAGEVFLGVAYLRAPDGDRPSVDYHARYDAEYSNEVTNGSQPTLSEEWERYEFRIEYSTDADAGNWWTEIWLSLQGDTTIDVGGMAVLSFGTDVDRTSLPAWDAVDRSEVVDEWPEVEDPYYQGLVDELSRYQIPPARFVYAQNEADTFASYAFGGGDGNAEQESLDVGDDVPFSEATRIEVTEAPENPWEVNLRADVQGRGVNDGDALLGVAWLRAPEGDGQVAYKSTESDEIGANYALDPRPDLTDEWERYFFPIGFNSDGAAGEWWTELWLGQQEQTVDVGGLALLDFKGGIDPVELPSWNEGFDLGDEWEQEADERIREHRTDDMTIELVDAEGEPVEGAAVDVAMQEHEFGFGTAVDAASLLDDATDDRYRETIRDLYNTAVLENRHKWRFFEEQQQLADDATAWLVEEGLDLRGHVCLWANVSAYAVPADVEDALEEGDGEYVRERTFEHVETIISHYADFREYGSVIDQWDVVNEVVHEPELIQAIDGEDVEPVEAPVLAEWYEHAEEVAPDDVATDVNDYNTLEGPYQSTRESYRQQIEYLTDEEVGVDGIGLQSHFGGGEALTPDELWDALESYAEYDREIRITEFDMADENWPEREKAEFFRGFLKTVFSHPAVSDFVMWGFKDDYHWREDAPLFYDDWTRKPSYDVYTNLVFDEWWTEESGETDGEGRLVVENAFHGAYEVTVEHDGGTETVTVSHEDDATVELALTDDGIETGADDEESGDQGGSDEESGDDSDGEDGEDMDGGDGEDASEADVGDDGTPGFGALTTLAGIGSVAGWALSRARGDAEATADDGEQ